MKNIERVKDAKQEKRSTQKVWNLFSNTKYKTEYSKWKSLKNVTKNRSGTSKCFTHQNWLLVSLSSQQHNPFLLLSQANEESGKSERLDPFI